MNFFYFEATAAFLVDILIGDPEYKFHPVRIMGKGIYYFEKHFRFLSRDQKLNGTIFCLFITLLFASVVFLIIFILSLFQDSLIIRIIKEVFIIYVIYSSIALGDLDKKAKEIYRLLKKGELRNARKKTGFIVGRDTKVLDEKEIIRATVETVAENITDGIISPLFYLFIGGAPLMIFYKAASTLDSMVGYKNERYINFGFFSAKLDDILNYIPARITGLILIPLSFLMLLKNGLKSFKIALRDGRKNPSPNSGFPEAGIAGGFGIQLGGANYYQSKLSLKPLIGDKLNDLNIIHIKEAVTISYLASILFFCACLSIRFIVENILLK